MVEEHDQLEERIDKLETFISGHIYADMTRYEQFMMDTQLSAMKMYVHALDRRIVHTANKNAAV
jgi:hypothetical protein